MLNEQVLKGAGAELEARHGILQGSAMASSDGSGEGSNVRSALERLTLSGLGSRPGPGKHVFWETQPVPQEGERSQERNEGPIDPSTSTDSISTEPLPLPEQHRWANIDLSNEAERKELHTLLTANYVEDDEQMFRFAYGEAFLWWAIEPPETPPEWHVGVRNTSSNNLVAFISAVPATLRIDSHTMRMAEIDFLCVHKHLRSKRLAPVLIQEVTRRVNLHGIFQAAYTAGTQLPRPVTTCRYWHRLLKPKKLVEVGFTRLGPRMNMSRTIKLHRLPTECTLHGLRQMRESDAEDVALALHGYLKNFRLAPEMSVEEVKHWLLPREGVVYSYVLEGNGEGNGVTDLVSFYSLPSQTMQSTQYDYLHAAFCFYYVPKTVSAQSLVYDALILAKENGFDVFNALDLLDNGKFMQSLKFGIGDGDLHYYLYNWRTKSDLAPHEVGLVLL
jgi:glycylpeptide N-tetradecanoyltransferase